MHILLATPIYGGAGPEYIGSMLRLQAWLLRQGIEVSFAHQAMAEVARSRNTLATHFWNRPQMTHLLFVDSDMSFQPAAVDKLIKADKPLVGCVYPKRSLNVGRLAAAAKRYEDPASIMAASLDFVVHPGGDSAEVVDGLCKVDGLGLGLCLIRRDVLATLMATGKIKQDEAGGRAGGHGGPILGFFDPIPTETTFLAEDLSFFRRWRETGGEIWAALDQEVGHVGTMTYSARVIDALKLGGA